MKTVRILITLVVLLIIIVIPALSQSISVLRTSKVIVMLDSDYLYHTVCVLNCIEFQAIMGTSSNVSIDGFTDELLAMENYLQRRSSLYGTVFVPLPRVK